MQDGILASAGRIVDRMIELKGMSQDMMKNEFDNATYENEFKDLQIQLYDMTQQTFNGVSLFAEFASGGWDRKSHGVFHAIPRWILHTGQYGVSIRKSGRKYRSQGKYWKSDYCLP